MEAWAIYSFALSAWMMFIELVELIALHDPNELTQTLEEFLFGAKSEEDVRVLPHF